MFKLKQQSTKSRARLGALKTAHGNIETPFFMPIATKAAVKNLTVEELKELGAQIILSNTYHLYLQPGTKILDKVGGLHKLMNWSGPILTDSGGFQVFSLSKIRKIKSNGVEFRSHLDGSKHLLTPQKVLKIQESIGSDIAMVLDVCPSSKADRSDVAEAVKLTTKWAKTAKIKNQKLKIKNLFGIVQGGLYRDLRLKSLTELVQIGFDGYAIGGLAVGETAQEMYQVLDYLVPEMPDNRPRYLMGVGTPENIIEAVKRGVDMFDCVIPTREARHGRLYISKSRKQKIKKAKNQNISELFDYEKINITNAKYKNDLSPINNTNLKQYSKAYLNHLFKTNEPLALRLASLNNLDFYLGLMFKIRQKIKEGEF